MLNVSFLVIRFLLFSIVLIFFKILTSSIQIMISTYTQSFQLHEIKFIAFKLP